MNFFEVICWDSTGRFCRAAGDDGLQWFTAIEQAETIANGIAKDPNRPDGIVRIAIYEAKPVKEVPYVRQSRIR